MAIGERIHFFRTMRGMTQKYLGILLGFPEKSADVRLAQYETGSRTPKADLTASLAQVLDVSPQALTVPDIDSYTGLMHTLFTLEDRYGLHIHEVDGELCLKVDFRQGKDAARLHEMLWAWQEQATKLETGEISKEEYDRWRYYYPEFDTTQRWAKVPSQAFSDLLMEAQHE
jgi:transcriptional regulator with XRE-family HTH domain